MKTVLLFFVLVLSTAISYGQGDLKTALKLASAGRYLEARAEVSQLVKKGDLDAVIFTGRTYSWEGKYDSALVFLKPMAAQNQPEAVSALIDVYYWSKNHVATIGAINHFNQQMQFGPDVLLKKLVALQQSEQFEAALTYADSLKGLYPADRDISFVQNELLAVVLKHQVNLNYFFQPNSDQSVWHMGSLDYFFRTKYLASGIRYTSANRFNNLGHQLELDFYPVFGKTTYANITFGISNDVGIFPNYRGGAELYHGLPAGFEVNGGVRYMKFTTKDIWLYTAEVGKYVGKFWFGGRFFYSQLTEGTGYAGVGTARYYLLDGNTFLSLTYSNGTIPTLVNFFDNTIAALRNQRISLDYTWAPNAVYKVRAGVWYENDQLGTDRFINRYTATVGLTRNF